MPIGITVNVCATLCGSIIGVLLGKRLSEDLKHALNNILGIAAISMGIVLIVRQHTLSAVVVLFCCGGTGWYGALNEGITGDGSILITKTILDSVTAVIFGSLLGKIVPVLCILQAIVYTCLFLVSIHCLMMKKLVFRQFRQHQMIFLL